MKILWFGVFDGIEYRSESPMVRGIEKCGGQVIQCNYRGETYTSIEDAVTQEHDIVFIQNGAGFKPDWMEILTKPVVYFASEFSFSRAKHIVNAARQPDYVICHSEQVLEKVKKKNIACCRLDHAYNPEHYFTISDVPFEYDFCFVGSLFTRRKGILKYLLKKLPTSTQIVTRAHPEKANSIYNSSRIVLHIHALHQNYIPIRLFEVLPTKGMLLIEEIGRNWDPRIGDQVCVQWKDKKELVEKIQYYLQSERERSRIVHNANVAAGNHTWDERMKQFYKVMEHVKQSTSV